MTKDIIKSYLELFSIIDMEDFGFPPLHEIILGIKHCWLKNAVMKWPAAIDRVDNEKRTLLMWASVRCNKAAIDILLPHETDPFSWQKNRTTVLHHAAIGGRLECV
jgi:hypothetical protein